jgi:hypothetical protein
LLNEEGTAFLTARVAFFLHGHEEAPAALLVVVWWSLLLLLLLLLSQSHNHTTHHHHPSSIKVLPYHTIPRDTSSHHQMIRSDNLKE